MNPVQICVVAVALGCLTPRVQAVSRQDRTVANTSVTLHYRLEYRTELNHNFHVAITFESEKPGKIAFAIPAWTPGYYQILHYESHIEHLAAHDETGTILPVTHPTARQWEVETKATAPHRVTLEYDVRADDTGLGFFASMVNPKEQLGYVNGASAFLYRVERKDAPIELTVALPKNWKLACPLEHPDEIETANPSVGPSSITLRAKNYDELIDSPIQIGKFDEVGFRMDGVNFRCILVGKSEANQANLLEALSRITHSEIAVFGSAPFSEYIFFFHCGGGGFYGGLEHRNSAVIHLFRPIGDCSDDSLLSVTAHEFFHAWNVKRIRPAGLGPFDYTQAVRTGSLWWAEGVTDYYAEVILVRSGLRSAKWFLEEMTGRIAMLQNTPTRTTVSLDEASRKAWEGGSEGFNGMSYYLKGSLVGFLLDLRIRALTRGRKRLDDAMCWLDSEYGSKDMGYPEDALERSVETVTQTSFRSEFERYVIGTDELDWKSVLPPIGFEFVSKSEPFLGVAITPSGESDTEVGVSDIGTNSPAARLGLRIGDRIRKMNAVPVTADTFASVVQSLRPDAPITLDVDRGTHHLTIRGSLGTRSTSPQIIQQATEHLAESTKRLRDAFLARDTAGTSTGASK